MSMDSPRGWRACVTLEQLALAVWVGGLITIIGAVIPSVFGTFPMEPAGRLLTRVFAGYDRLVGGAIVVLVAGLAWRAWRGSPASRWPEALLLGVMVAVAAAISFVAAPRTVVLQEQAFAAQAGPEKQAAYDAFFRSHQIVRGLYLVNLAFGVGLMAVRVKRAASEQA
jgi:hypothetical protein